MKNFLAKMVKLFNKLKLGDEHREASRYSRRAEILNTELNRKSTEQLRKEMDEMDDYEKDCA